MEHGFLDKYAYLESPIHKIEPRIKTALIFVLIFATALVQENKLQALATFLLLAFVGILLSKINLTVALKRLLIILPPAVALSAVYSIQHRFNFDPYLFVFYLMKAIACFLFVFLLVSTTKFDVLLKTLRFYRVPVVIISILSFLYRYVFVVQDEFERMMRAHTLKTNGSKRKLQLRSYFNMVGILFMRTYERSERIHRAMLSKGYDPEIAYLYRPGPLKTADLLYLLFGLILTSGVYLLW